MSELISGKEALIALANGEEVEYSIVGSNEWHNKTVNIAPYYFIGNGVGQFEFRLKPRTITLNGIEVPAPFKPKEGEIYWYIVDIECGYNHTKNLPNYRVSIAAWRTEDEIKQVVSALRSILNKI